MDTRPPGHPDATPVALASGHVNTSPADRSGQVKGEPDNNIHYRKCAADAGEGNPGICLDLGPEPSGHVNALLKGMCQSCPMEPLCEMDAPQVARCAARARIPGTYAPLEGDAHGWPGAAPDPDRVDGPEVYALRWSIEFGSGFTAHGIDRVFDAARLSRALDCDAGPSVLWSQPYVWVLKDGGDRFRGPSVSIMGRFDFGGLDAAKVHRFLELEGYVFDCESGDWLRTWEGWDPDAPNRGNVSTCRVSA